MKKNYINEIKEEVKSYFSKDLKNEKYFYLDIDYFSKQFGLSYEFFYLNKEMKSKINDKAKELFISSDVSFKLKENSTKNDVEIKISTEYRKHYNRSEIFKEYLFFKVLESLGEEELCKIQRKNFIFSYLNHYSQDLIKHNLIEPFKSALNIDTYNSYYKEMILWLKQENSEKSIINKKIDLLQTLYIKTGEPLDFLVFLSLDDREIFKHILNYCGRENQEYELFFRGQGNSSFKLWASIFREPSYLYYEGDICSEILSLKPSSFKEDKSTYEKLITMQHFGLPTRLLDITTNPLIALYFACNEFPNKDGALFIIKEKIGNIKNFESPELNCLNHIIKLKDKNFSCKNCDKSCKDKNDLKGTFIVRGIANNDRVNSQSGNFILVGVGEDIKYKPELSQEIEKIIIIDKSLKSKILKDLMNLNIHAGTVYPDLSNMNVHLKEVYKNKLINQEDWEKIYYSILYGKDEEKSEPQEEKAVEKYTQSEETTVIFTTKASALSPNEIFEDINFELFYSNFKGCNEKYKEKLENLYISYFRYICDLNEELLIDDIKDSLKGYKPYKDKFELKRILYSMLNSLKVIAYLKSANSLKITIVEQTFDWKGYFADPNNVKVPIYNENDWAVEGCELQRIESESLVVTIKEKDSFPTKYLNFNKLISYSTDYDGLILIMDYKDKSLFEDYWRNGDIIYAEPVKD